jgi:site-specific recombinase XerC
MLLDYLVTGGILPANPASSVRGPKYSIKRGKTPVLTAEEARQLLAAIETDTIIGLRDRALIAVMIYSLARISAAVSMRVEDYFQAGKRWKLRFMERGGKFNEVFAHRTASAGARGSGIRKIPIGIDRQAGLTGSRTLSYKSMGTLKEYDPEPHL